MKKLLSLILVPSLLLSGNGYSAEINSSTTTPITNDDVTITSSGSITTTSNPSISISNAVNDGKTIDNAGTIITSGFRNQGIFFYLSGSHDVTNSGTISTSGERAQAIRLSSSDNNTVINSGILSTTGDEADGIKFYLSDSNTVTITSSGSITTSGNEAYGIDLEGSSNNTIINEGRITTEGASSHLIYLSIGTDVPETRGDNNTITNSGILTSSENNISGIYINNSDNNTITNNGTIKLTGTNSNIIYITGSSSSNEFTLNSKNIIGRIKSDSSASNTLNIDTDYGNSSYFISTTGNWNIVNNNSSDIPNTSTSQVSTGRFKNSSDLLFQRNKSLNNFIIDHNNKFVDDKNLRVNIYYDDTDRNSPKSYNTIDSDRYGFNIIGLTQNDKINVLLNFEEALIFTDNKEFRDEQDSFLIGLNIPEFHKIGSTKISYKGLIGKTFHKTARKVYTNKNILNNSSGSVITKRDYNSHHLIFGAYSFIPIKKTDFSNFGLSLGADVNTSKIDGYSDDFFTYDKSNLSQLETLIKLSYQSQVNDKLFLSSNLNTKTRKIFRGTNQSYSLNNITKNYTSDKSDVYYGGALNLSYKSSNKFIANFGLEIQESNDNASSIGGSVSLNYKF